MTSTLPPALAGMGAYPQFIVWRLLPGPKKPIKSPVDPTSGLPINAHDSQNQMTFGDAAAAADRSGGNVGFVFTERDPFFFVDVDNAREGDGWSAHATTIFGMFPGAAFELSQSGQGFHLFGVCSDLPEHSNRRDDLGLEFYTKERFVALTLVNTSGDISTDLGAHARHFAGTFFPPREHTVDGAWTDAPSEDWLGPEDDATLLKRMLASKPSANATFRGAATVRDLWEANEEVLGANYPPNDSSVEAFNHSSADAALCKHLAFWTGGDCERIDRLFRASGLMREKWERFDYRRGTVLLATSGCTAYYRDPRQAPVEPEGAEIVATLQYLAPDQQLAYFEGCTYIADRHRVLTPKGTMLTPASFKATYGGYVFGMDHESSDTVRNAWEAFTESRALRWPKVDTTAFRPEDPPGTVYEEEGRSLVNTYVPAVIDSRPGDVAPFLGLLNKLACVERDRAILLSYMAACVQYPGVKFQWCPVLQGVEGNGKSFFLRVVAHAVGQRYSHFPNARDLANPFTGWLEGKLFIGVEEIYQDHDRGEVAEALKTMVTNDRMEMQPKGVDQYTGDNRANLMMCSNHKDAVAKTLNDRRYAIFYTAQQCPEDLVSAGMTDDKYFPDLYRWLNHEGGLAFSANFLKTYKIDEEFNPATKCHRAPTTSSTSEAIDESRGPVEQIIVDAIEEGRVGFRGHWISSTYLNALFERSRSSFNARRNAVENLGYIPHPGLLKGRVSVRIPSEDNRKPTLYVKRGSIRCTLRGPEVKEAYLADQEIGPEVSGSGLTLLK